APLIAPARARRIPILPDRGLLGGQYRADPSSVAVERRRKEARSASEGITCAMYSRAVRSCFALRCPGTSDFRQPSPRTRQQIGVRSARDLTPWMNPILPSLWHPHGTSGEVPGYCASG